ncbi:MAG: hypothetical protein AAGJ94_18085 [Pseudomonadota bacterium]
MPAYLRFEGLEGESANMPDGGSDLLIVNNGDGSDFMEGATAASSPMLAKLVSNGRHYHDEDSPSFETISFNFIEIDSF